MMIQDSGIQNSGLRLRLAHLYPSQMNIYGDRGNVTALQKRAEWRGIGFEWIPVEMGQEVDFSTFDLVFIGGGQDAQQALVAEDLKRVKGASLKAAVEGGLVLLSICGGYQLLGNSFLTHEGKELEGVGLFDLSTVGGKKRMIGNSLIRSEIEGKSVNLVGFENHSGKTYLGSGVKPLGKVHKGYGNNGEDGSEGAIYKNAYGTYLHGSLLPKNPELADHLLFTALRRRYGEEISLPGLDDALEKKAKSVIMERM